MSSSVVFGKYWMFLNVFKAKHLFAFFSFPLSGFGCILFFVRKSSLKW